LKPTGSRRKRHSFDIASNPYLVGWIPKTHTSLFKVSRGQTIQHYRLIDWDKGEQLWEVPPPGTGEVLAVGITPRLLLFEEAELYKPGSWSGPQFYFRNDGKEWVRTFYAVSIHDGSVVARWQAAYPQRLSGEQRDRFLWMNDRLFYITANEVTELNLDDIASKKNGWTTNSAH
jgi:hypothetical protein